MRFLMRSARQRGVWCRGSSKNEKVKLREKLRLVTGRSGGRRGGWGTRCWGNTFTRPPFIRNSLTPPSAETDRDKHGEVKEIVRNKNITIKCSGKLLSGLLNRKHCHECHMQTLSQNYEKRHKKPESGRLHLSER